MKAERAALLELTDGCFVSEEVGYRNPDPRIFETAARELREPLDGAWVIGDSPDADVGGAVAAGLRSVWLTRGGSWPALPFAPTHRATTPAEAVAILLEDAHPRTRAATSTDFP